MWTRYDLVVQSALAGRQGPRPLHASAAQNFELSPLLSLVLSLTVKGAFCNSVTRVCRVLITHGYFLRVQGTW